MLPTRCVTVLHDLPPELWTLCSWWWEWPKWEAWLPCPKWDPKKEPPPPNAWGSWPKWLCMNGSGSCGKETIFYRKSKVNNTIQNCLLIIKNSLKSKEESNTYLTHISRHHWSKFESDRCRSFSFILKDLSFYLSRFSFYINIVS